MGLCQMDELLWNVNVDLLEANGAGKGIASSVCDSAQPPQVLLTLF